MNYKKSNRVFMCVVILLLIFPFILDYSGRILGYNFSSWTLVLNQIIIFLVAGIGVLCCRERPNDVLHFHAIRFSSVGMIFLFVILIYPVTTLLNVVTQLFTPNTVVLMSDSTPASILLISMCIVAPICEEFCFRGVIFRGYKNSCGSLTAILLTGLLFGLFHCNLNQFFYAFLLGIFLCLTLEETGSLLATMLMHCFFNCFSGIIMPYVLNFLPDHAITLIFGQENTVTWKYILILFILSVIFTPFAVMVLRCIGRNEKYKESLVVKRMKNGEIFGRRRFISLSLVIGVLLCLITMGILQYMIVMWL